MGPRLPLPKGSKAGQPQDCFKNALLLVLKNPGFIYVEGFARHLIGRNCDCIEHHAWAVDAAGRVYDPTWKHGVEYFGIPFRQDYVEKTMRSIFIKGGRSLLDNSIQDYPLLRARSTRGWLLKMDNGTEGSSSKD